MKIDECCQADAPGLLERVGEQPIVQPRVTRQTFTLEQRARIRAAAAWVADRAATVVGAAYRSCGGSVIYAASP